jgi:hypothetical protein
MTKILGMRLPDKLINQLARIGMAASIGYLAGRYVASLLVSYWPELHPDAVGCAFAFVMAVVDAFVLQKITKGR